MADDVQAVRPAEGADALLTPGEVARLFGVDPKTVTRWARVGKLNPLRTLGGHRRYRASEVNALLQRGERRERRAEAERAVEERSA